MIPEEHPSFVLFYIHRGSILHSICKIGERFARRDTKWLPPIWLQMDLLHQAQYGERQVSELEGLKGTLARSTLGCNESLYGLYSFL